MAEESPPSPHSGGKHRRSQDDGHDSALEEDASKRRRCHHHHRRHHGKHSHEEDEEMESEEAEAAAPSDAPPLRSPSVYDEKHVDDEREEGEILDDEEVDGPVDGGRGMGMTSDAISGEIAAGAVDDSSPDPIFSGEENDLACERTKELGADGMCKSSQTIEEFVTTCESKNDVDGPNGVAHASSIDNKAYRVMNNGIGLRKETVNRQSRSPEWVVEKEKKHRRDRNDHKIQGGSRSSISEEGLHAIKHPRRDDKESTYKAHILEGESRKYMQTMDASGRVLDKKNRSSSPRSSWDKYNPSSNSQHHESWHRDRSRSRDPPSRRSYEKCSEPSGYDNHRAVQEYPSESLGNDDRSGRLDGYPNRIETRDKDNYMEREKSSSYNKHDERHHRERVGEREREKQNISVIDRDYIEVDRGVQGEREIISYSRYERCDRRQSRERGREHERDIYGGGMRWSHRDRSKDMSEDKYKERERSKDSDHRRGRDGSDTYRNRVREREVSAHEGREELEQIERDRTSSRDRHKDSRHSNYDAERYKDKRRSKELFSDVGSGREHTAGAREQSISAREEDVGDYEEKIERQLVKQDEDIDKIKEESRKRRQTILEKYRQRQQQEQQLQQIVESLSDVNNKDNEASSKENLQGPVISNAENQTVNGEVQNEQENVDVYVADPSFTVNKSPMGNEAYPSKMESTDHGLGEGSPKSERSTDIFTDDIFGESPAAVRKMHKGDGPKMERNFLHDNWDDAEGYYSYRFGEVLDGRYEVISAHGKGVFSTVVRAKDLKAGRVAPEEVAIKIIRNNETMYKADRDELLILKKLAAADPEDKRHCVRFLSSFKYRNHLCLIFESLHMNLREVLKKFGRNIGLKLTAVRAYAKQLFIALKHLRNCGVLHCDIKPDNMLVNETKNVLKLCDFGSAMFAGKNEITPYLVSRFYRAPEIILGLAYDHPMDIWSVGCCLYELYTGKVLFPGPSNNDMLRLHMELKGPFPKKMLRKGAFVGHHFDEDLNFHATEEDTVPKKPVKRLLLSIKPKEISTLISGSLGEDPRMLANFKDLLEQIFILDPEKRMTVHQALSHPFITGK